GADSTVSESNTVSVGSVGNERKITNVANGTKDTDAATVGQVKSLIASSSGENTGKVDAYTKTESDTKFATKKDMENIKNEKVDISTYNSDKANTEVALQNKADKDATNLSANDVKAWRDKLGVISNTATDSKSTSIGNNNKVTGSSSTAVGYKNEVSGNKSGAFGDPNIITGNRSYAFGNDNTIAGNDNFVLGSNVNIGAGISNSVALGNNSTVKASNEVSVGSTGNERKITNVADGELSSTSTDAVTGKQLFDVMQNSGTTGIKNLRNEINKKLDDTRDEMRGIGALSASLSALHPMQYDPKAPNQIMAGVGTYKNKQAVAVGMSHYFKENVMMTAGIALSNERKTNAMANLGVTWKIGKGGETSAEIPQSVIQNEMARLARENQEQKAENRELKARVQRLEEALNKLLNK
ncbi:MAG: YadA-like family protein, partial [Fusobacterium sp.]|nr:YadA-like family protein [Fusobacterium sp.]